jgi:hypothetical protein
VLHVLGAVGFYDLGVHVRTVALREGVGEQRLDYMYVSILSRSGRAVAARRHPVGTPKTKTDEGRGARARGAEGRRGAKKQEVNPTRTMPWAGMAHIVQRRGAPRINLEPPSEYPFPPFPPFPPSLYCMRVTNKARFVRNFATQVASHGKMSRVPSAHLEILSLPELRHLCEKLGVPKSGNKGELISRLVTARISYDNLLMDDLKDILYQMELPVSGNKSELIARIIGRDSSSARGASSASEVIRGNQRPSEVNHRHSLAIRGQTDPRRSRWPHRVLSDHRACACVCVRSSSTGNTAAAASSCRSSTVTTAAAAGSTTSSTDSIRPEHLVAPGPVGSSRRVGTALATIGRRQPASRSSRSSPSRQPTRCARFACNQR